MTKKLLLPTVFLAGVIMATAASAIAGEAAPPIPALDQRISLELREASADDVFRTFETVLGSPASGVDITPPVRVELEDGIDRPLTICLREVTVRTALAAVCESLRCALAWRLDGGGYVLGISPEETADPIADQADKEAASLDQPVDLDLEEAELGSVLRTVGAIMNRKVVIDQRLGGRLVSLSVEATPLREVLDLLCQQAGCRWSETMLGLLAFEPR